MIYMGESLFIYLFIFLLFFFLHIVSLHLMFWIANSERFLFNSFYPAIQKMESWLTHCQYIHLFSLHFDVFIGTSAF